MIKASRIAAIQGPAEEGWQPLRPRTLVDLAIEAIMAGAVRGLVLPGDRIVESDIAQRLGVSRVPVREALRILESQGIVINEPYKGIRLTPFTPERLDQVIETRVALEVSAASRAIRLGRNDETGIMALQRCINELELMQARGDAYGFASADTGFHRTLLGLSGNNVLCGLWEGLSRQLTIFFGLSTLGKPMSEIVNEHRTLITVFHSGDPAAMGQALGDHISVQTHAVDYAGIIARRRAELERSQPGLHRGGTRGKRLRKREKTAP
jgi:DNA-binding GntR family transcriptional regulator